MKKNFYLMTAFCAIILSACSADTDPAPTTEKDRTAKLEISLVGTTTRATGTLPADDNTDEQTVFNIVIGIFKSSGEVLTIQGITNPTVGSGSSQIISFPLTQDENSCTAVVVANVPESKIPTLKAANSRDNFLGVTLGLQETTASGGKTQLSNKLPMSGDVKDREKSTFDLVSGETKTGLSVLLSRMVSRISIADIKTAFDPIRQYKDATFTATDIFLYNAKSTSTVNPATPVTTDLISGEEDGYEYLKNALSNVPIPADGYTTPYWFYTFANDATKPTKLVIKGKFDADGDSGSTYEPEDVYYPVVINKSQLGTEITGGGSGGSGDATISRNTAYKIGVTIKGKGVASAADDIVPPALTINVSVNDWDLVINQNVVFD